MSEHNHGPEVAASASCPGCYERGTPVPDSPVAQTGVIRMTPEEVVRSKEQAAVKRVRAKLEEREAMPMIPLAEMEAGVAAPDGELHDAVAAARLEELRWVLNRAGVIQGRRIGEYRADLSDDIRARIAGLLTPTDRGTPQSGQEEA